MNGIAHVKRPAASGDGTQVNEWVDQSGVQQVGIASTMLTRGGARSELVTCTSANIDYATLNPMPPTTRIVVVSCPSACTVAMGEVTSGNRTGPGIFDPAIFDPAIFDTGGTGGGTYATGVAVQAGVPRSFAVAPTGIAAFDTPHCQSATGGAVVRFTYLTS